MYEPRGAGGDGRTFTLPAQRPSPQPARLVLRNLEPHGALAVKGRGRLAGGHLGEVEVRRARVEDGRAAARGDGYGAAGRDAEGARGAAAWVELVARHGFGADVGDGAVVEAVLGRADGFPVGGALAVVEGAGEGV